MAIDRLGGHRARNVWRSRRGSAPWLRFGLALATAGSGLLNGGCQHTRQRMALQNSLDFDAEFASFADKISTNPRTGLMVQWALRALMVEHWERVDRSGQNFRTQRPRIQDPEFQERVIGKALEIAENFAFGDCQHELRALQEKFTSAKVPRPSRVRVEKDPRKIVMPCGDYAGRFSLPQDFAAEAAKDERLKNLSQLNFNLPHFFMPTPFGEMHYVRAGNSRGRTIVLLAGVPDSLFTYHRLIQVLAPGYDVVAIDLPGKGYSEVNENFDFTLDAYAYALRMMIRKLGLTDVILVGHSSGFSEALHALMVYGPGDLHIAALVSLNGWGPAALPEPLPLDFSERLAGSELLGSIVFDLNRAAKGAFVRDFVRQDLKATLTPADLAPVYEAFDPLLTEYTRVWVGEDSGYRPEKAWAGVRTERILAEHVQLHYESHSANRAHLRQVPILAFASTEEAVVIGPQDKRRPGGRNGLHLVDQEGKGMAHRLFERLDAESGLPENRLYVLQGSSHMSPLDSYEIIGRILKERFP